MRERIATLDRQIYRGSLLFIGVLGILALFSVAVLNGLVTRYSMQVFRSYTEDVPMYFVPPRYSVEMHQTLQSKLSSYLQEHGSHAPVQLEADELNLLLWSVPALRERVRVLSVTPRGIQALVSLPYLSDSKLRYLNGIAEMNVDFDLGYLRVFIESMKVKGHSLPKRYVGALGSANLVLKVLYPNAAPTSPNDFRLFLWKTGSIELGDGEVRMIPLSESNQLKLGADVS